MKSGLSGWVLAIARTLDASGVPYEPIFHRVGMDPLGLKEGNNRYSQEMVSRLWRAAVEETADEHFGLKVAAQIRPSTFNVVGYAMNCSATLGDAINRFSRYAKLISNSATVSLHEAPGGMRVQFDFDTGGAAPIFQTIDTVLAGLVSFSSWIAGQDVIPLRVNFKHPRPADTSAYSALLKCPLFFDQDSDDIVFAHADLERTVLSGDEQLAALLDGMAITQMAQLSERFAKKVRDCLVKQFSEGEISRKGTAELMLMTERTLLRRLKDEGTTFQEVLDRLREELAYEYLRRSDTTVQMVSFMLGFSDASTFSRAFKRWTGRRPSLAQSSPQPAEKNNWAYPEGALVTG